MKYLIFGGSGFVGKNLVNLISEKGDKVKYVSRSGNGSSIKLDITVKEDFEKLSYVPDVIVNCASRIPKSTDTLNATEYIKELFLTNVIGASNITNWAVKNNVPKIINCSTLVVVKKPWPVPLTESFSSIPDGRHAGYSMSKLSQEQLMNECVNGSETKIIHLRLSAVYGAGMVESGIIFDLLKKFKNNETVSLKDAEKMSFDFINVLDVCKSIMEIAQKDFQSEVINVASGKSVSLMDLANSISDNTNSNSEIYNENTDREVSKAEIDVEKLKNKIGPSYNSFLSLKEGLIQTLNSSAS